MSYSLRIVAGGKPTKTVLTYDGAFMSSMLLLLTHADAIDEDAKELTAPRWPPAGLKATSARLDQLAEYVDIGGKLVPPRSASEERVLAKYQAADEKFRRGKPGRKGRIPKYKFQSNDRWIVTSTEARTLADRIRWVLETDGELEIVCDFLDLDRKDSTSFEKETRKLLAFCSRASSADGFTVS